MKLEEILKQKRSVVLKKWFNLILEDYQIDTAGFLRQEKDRFANPVGYTISHEIEGIYDELLQATDFDKIISSLYNIIRIRAVQDCSASEATGFAFLLKKAIREEVKNESQEIGIIKELLEFDSKIDKLASLSFDIYMKCREKLYEIRANELRNRSLRVLQRANLLCTDPEEEPDSTNGDINNH